MSEYLESNSIASSTSWWMLEKKQEKAPSYAVVTLTQQQYDILVEVSNQTRYLGCGFHWRRSKDPIPWDSFTTRPIRSLKNCLALPLCYLWFGHLRFALMKHGGVDSESLYLSIVNAVTSTASYQTHYNYMNVHLRKMISGGGVGGSSKPLLQQLYPLQFLVFRHLNNGQFEMQLRFISPGIKLVPFSSNPLEHSSEGCGLAISISDCSYINISKSSAPVNNPVVLAPVKASSCNAKLLESGLTTTEEDDQKKEFDLELRRCFALCYKEIQESAASEVDRSQELLQITDTKQWESITTDIGDFLEHFLKTEGERIMLS